VVAFVLAPITTLYFVIGHWKESKYGALTALVGGVLLLMASGCAGGDGEDEFNAGLALYHKGDHTGALLKWRDAAGKGNANAMFNIGVLYDQGQGVKQDYAEAMRWWRKAADKGVADAMSNIGVLYEQGQGVEQDYAEAMRWYRKAADKGHATAKAALQRLRDR